MYYESELFFFYIKFNFQDTYSLPALTATDKNYEAWFIGISCRLYAIKRKIRAVAWNIHEGIFGDDTYSNIRYKSWRPRY